MVITATLVAVMMPALFGGVEPVAVADPGNHYHFDDDTNEQHVTHQDPGNLSTGSTTVDDGTGNADPDSPHIPYIIPGGLIPGWNFGYGDLLDQTPCVDYDTVVGMVPDGICADYDGYAYGYNINNNLENQRVCFSELREDPEPSVYFIENRKVPVNTTLTLTQALVLGLPNPNVFGEPLDDAITQYNADRTVDIGGVQTADAAYEVATIPDYSNTGYVNLRGSLVQYYDWPYTAYPPDMGNGKIHPIRMRWSEDVMGMDRTDTWTWTWTWTVDVYNTYDTCYPYPDPPGGEWCGTVRGAYQFSYNTTTSRSASAETPTHTQANPPLGPGLSPWNYFNALWLRTNNEPAPSQPAAPNRRVPCSGTSCSSSLDSTDVTYQKGAPSWFDARTDWDYLPAFWKVYQEYGIRDRTEQGNAEHITQLSNQGVDWLDPARAEDYQITYFLCEAARNGGVFEAWEVGVPFPRLGPSSWTFTTADNAVAGNYLLPPDPQSIPGMHTALHTPGAQSAPPVHVPVPLFDVGSGVNLNPPTPDGEWWATVGTIDDEMDCVNATVPICLAKATRPWRAIWYIEAPPSASVFTTGGQIPSTHPRTPSDVRACYYSNSATANLLDDIPVESSSSGGEYQVAVPVPAGAGSMMHTLPGLSDNAKIEWLTDWLYGTGSNLARAYGQDQVDPDRYCWYKWYQAQNDLDGFEGVLAVEWLTTLYIGVPSDPFAYCQGGVQGIHDGINANPRHGNVDGGPYNCHYGRNANYYAPLNYWKAVADNWNDTTPGSPSASLFWFGRQIPEFSNCHVGSARLDNMEQPFDWFLQAATIIVENEQEAGSSNREAMHPLGSGNSPNSIGNSVHTGRTPGLLPSNPALQPGSSLSNNWWRGNSSSAVGTPQNQATTLNNPMFSTPPPDDSGLLAQTNAWRKYQPQVTPLTYPTSLSVPSGHPECNPVPVTVKSLPCQSWSSGACRASTKSWWKMFNYQVDSSGSPVISGGRPVPSNTTPPTESPNSNLWAWWSQGVGEVRHQTFPIPVDP